MHRGALLSLVDRPGAVLLDGWSDGGRWTIALPEPIDEFRSDSADESALEAFFGRMTPFRASPTGDAPFAGGWVGYLSYELGARWEGAAARPDPLAEPAALFYRHESGWAIDPAGKLVSFGSPKGEPVNGPIPEASARIRSSPLAESLPDGRYERAHDAIRRGIARGDFYQVNLTNRFCAPLAQRIDPRSIYRRMTDPAPPPYSLLLRGEGFDVISASPELFLRADFAAGAVEMRPIKGTASRHRDGDRDREAALRLAASPKDRAENVMIVDLCRNDLGRVCRTGTVEVARLCEIRSHRVHHLESTIQGRLRPETSPADLLRATFPPGSVTGAPKRAAVAAIRKLEPVARGVYTGAAGFFDDRGRLAFNVAIRTAIATDRDIRYHAGGGITWDSVAASEREELGWKAREFFSLFAGYDA
jgi:anthranilate/para-aminobenzoate synthase component I